MLFNSYGFIFIYLPITLLVFFVLGRHSDRTAALWLTLASFVFYAWWNPIYVLLLAGSIVFNYFIGAALSTSYNNQESQRTSWFLFVGIAANLTLLAYYKYTNFFVSSVNDAFGTGYQIEKIVLPIGISFFTFTQIAFLVDASRGYAREYNFVHYCLFVTYFPHLIAGPVLHHKEMMPQFAQPETYRFSYDNFANGSSLFFFGLFKKLVLADNISTYASPVFDAAAHGIHVTFLEAWGGAFSYTLQLYFDFSGYSDMAIGMSRMIGVELPNNFNSPYRATNIIEFWRRWHMSLSRFLRDYLYIPLGGNRKGKFRRHINLLITMLLGGLWHGANWTFLVWGGLHGIYLVVNHSWQSVREQLGFEESGLTLGYRLFSGLITFLAVVVAWVFFRADSIKTALVIIEGMSGRNGMALPLKWIEGSEDSALVQWLFAKGVKTTENYDLFGAGAELRLIAALLLICWLLPNTIDVFGHGRSDTKFFWKWKPSAGWATLTVLVAYFAILSISDLSEFIYFQF